MRSVIRLLLLVGLVLSGAALSPLSPSAWADPSSSASGSPSGEASSTSPGDTPTDQASSTPASPSSPATPSTPSSSAPSSGAPSASAPTSAPSAGKARAAAGLVTTIHSHPLSPSTSGRAAFTFSANARGVRFHCRLTGPGRPRTVRNCPVTGGSATSTTGSYSYRGLTGSRKVYKFTVQAYVPSTMRRGQADAYRFRVFNTYRPIRFVPSTGATFNRPLTGSRQRRNLNRVIHTVNGMPGYKQAYPGLCPADPALSPGMIHISLYSLTDEAVAKALIAASHRCLSVQVLMNNHLSRKTDPAWRHLEDALGYRVRTRHGTPRRSFAHRCHSGCRGGGVLHTKMYLFNSTIPRSNKNRILSTTMFGSTNMTSNAAKVQYNDLFAQTHKRDLFLTFSRMFNLMKRDNGYHRNPGTYHTGVYRTTFWPQAAGATDPYRRALDSVYCKGATGGTGTHGRTLIYINMHAWFGTRGISLARKVRSLYAHGCYVRVLYGFMSYKVFRILHSNTNSRMSVRRILFSHNGQFAYVYTHFKNINVSGHVGRYGNARVTWTGSNNFTNEGYNFDEVTVRIAARSAYASYVRQFKYMRDRLSSATYANFSEPTGGGRAPRQTALAQLGLDPNVRIDPSVPSDTPIVRSPAVRVNGAGEPYALD